MDGNSIQPQSSWATRALHDLLNKADQNEKRSTFKKGLSNLGNTNPRMLKKMHLLMAILEK